MIFFIGGVVLFCVAAVLFVSRPHKPDEEQKKRADDQAKNFLDLKKRVMEIEDFVDARNKHYYQRLHTLENSIKDAADLSHSIKVDLARKKESPEPIEFRHTHFDGGKLPKDAVFVETKVIRDIKNKMKEINQ